MAIVLPVDLRAAVWARPNGWGMFQPNGRRRFYGTDFRKNPKRWESGSDVWAARLFVGFRSAVDHDVIYAMDDLVPIVRDARIEQTGDPSSSFLSQHGLYRHDDGTLVEEPGAQVILINVGEAPDKFEQHMIELAEAIASELDQEEVVVELQRGGITQRVFGVGVEA